MYTDDKNAQVILSLLKKYNIKKIVISPGTTNVPISRSVQLDPWFEVYSVVDERSAAYFAGGLAYASKEPVVISCTGATASRNYLPGLTEAYYRGLPVIALTSQHHVSDFGNLVPQVTDRTVSQNDIKKVAVQLPVVKDDEDYERCVLAANKALIAATTNGNGPVHINLHVVGDYSFTTQELPDVRKIDYYENAHLANDIQGLNKEIDVKKIGVFIGAHHKFDEHTEGAIEAFAVKYKAPVFVDHTSSYKGKNAVLIAQIADLKWSPDKPDLIIDMGSVTGEYSVNWLMNIDTWRLSEDGQIHDRFGRQSKLFYGSEKDFFEAFSEIIPLKGRPDYYDTVHAQVKNIVIPSDIMPLSNTYISYSLSRSLPEKANVHLGILNSLRNMNFYKLDSSIDTSSNVGGFGIDGALSTLMGQSVADRQRLNFGLVGDLAAFYDMNALGIRHISNNVRILLVNNDGGVEFRLNAQLETQWADDTTEFISAGGHNGSMKGWAESMNFKYMSATNKEEFDALLKEFTSNDLGAFSQPVLFEVFTTIPDEQNGIMSIQEANRHPVQASQLVNERVEHVSGGRKLTAKDGVRQGVKDITPEPLKRIYRKLRDRD